MQQAASPEQLKQELEKLAKKFSKRASQCKTEEQTKMSLINPYLQALGWDSADPDFVRAEHFADFEKKNAERVDYALLKKEGKKEEEILVLVEAKPAHTDLPSEAPAQLQRYFQAETARFAVLTNGICWQWYYQDPEGKSKRLAKKPFLKHDTRHVTGQEVSWLWSIHPDRFDSNSLETKAWQSAVQGLLEQWFQQNLKPPSDEFIRFLIKQTRACRITSAKIRDMKEPAQNALKSALSGQLQEGGRKQVGSQSSSPNPGQKPSRMKTERNPLHVEDWVPITEWKRFQPQGGSGKKQKTIWLAIQFPDGSEVQECRGYRDLARRIIDWIDAQPASALATETRIIRFPRGNRVFGNTESEHLTGRSFWGAYHAPNIGMSFELHLSSKDMMIGITTFLETFGIDLQTVMIRTSPLRRPA